ncbi:hypothetical protein INT46_006067 [Mucor plumbeus]|uniref:Uncharacterized protein n=1 Tax=Mucor plumbeus TaxID=97098 RepID=A0A8H7QSD9_9FUNG|nr:hypothetical protein INT46_006067 [Mucor plumbeus]
MRGELDETMSKVVIKSKEENTEEGKKDYNIYSPG